MILGLGPWGTGPWGVDDAGGVDLSVANPLDALLHESLARKTYLMRSRPWDPALGERVDVKISSDGFGSDSGDTLPDGTPYAHKLFRAGLVVPFNSQTSIMSQLELAASNPTSDQRRAPGKATTRFARPKPGASPSTGELVVEGATGRFSYLLGLNFDEAETEIYLGRPEWPLSQFGPIFSGVTGPIQVADPLQIRIPLVDNSYLLTRAVQREHYRGMGAALRGNGSSTYGSVTLAKPSGSCTMQMWVRPKTSATAQKYLMGWQNSSLAGGFFLRLESGATNRVAAYAINDAGASPFVVHFDSLPAGAMSHVAAVLDASGSSLSLHVTIRGEMTTVTTAVSGAFTTALTAFKVMRRPDTSAGFADIDIDEAIIWSEARSVDQIIAYRDREIPGDTAGLYAYWRVDEGTGSTLFDSTSGGHDIAVSGTVAWVGTLEGDATVAGQAPPFWEGVNYQVQPVLVDAQNGVYEVGRGPTPLVVTNVSDKGAATLTMDTAVSDIYDASPASGHCVTAVMDGRTLLRLGVPPQGTLTVTATSDALDTAAIVRKFAQQWAGWVDGQLDLSAFVKVSADHPETVCIGRRTPSDSDTIWAMMQELAGAAQGWVIMTRSGLLTIGILEAPENLPSKFTLNENDIAAAGLTGTLSAFKRAEIAYKPYSTVQQASNLATSIGESARADLGQPYRYVSTPIDPDITAIRSRASDREDTSLYADQADAYNEAVRRAALWGVDRATYSLDLTRGLYQYSIGDIVQVSCRAEAGDYVVNLQALNAVVVGFTEDPSLDTIKLDVWGQLGALLAPDDLRETDAGDVRITDDGASREIDY